MRKTDRARSERLSLPVMRIRKLAKMAIELGLSSLEVGDIKIVPGAGSIMTPVPQKTLPEKIRGATYADGSPLSKQHQDDLMLFGEIIGDQESDEH